MGIFDEKKQISRISFREKLKGVSGQIPGSPGRRYSMKERVKIEKELFGPKFGGHISEKEFKYGLKKLSRERLKCKTLEEKRSVERKIRYLKKIGGI